jgi:hypothetical protein
MMAATAAAIAEAMRLLMIEPCAMRLTPAAERRTRFGTRMSAIRFGPFDRLLMALPTPRGRPPFRSPLRAGGYSTAGR